MYVDERGRWWLPWHSHPGTCGVESLARTLQEEGQEVVWVNQSPFDRYEGLWPGLEQAKWRLADAFGPVRRLWWYATDEDYRCAFQPDASERLLRMMFDQGVIMEVTSFLVQYGYDRFDGPVRGASPIRQQFWKHVGNTAEKVQQMWIRRPKWND